MPEMSQAEVMNWLFEKPEVRAWVWDQLSNLMTFSAATQTWSGIPQTVIKQAPVVDLKAFDGLTTRGHLVRKVMAELKCSCSTAERAINKAIRQGTLSRVGRCYSRTVKPSDKNTSATSK